MSFLGQTDVEASPHMRFNQDLQTLMFYNLFIRFIFYFCIISAESGTYLTFNSVHT
ncbi:hypothetical protein HanIR_Chr13g0651521 [Helianthus annuus]|nr:hypothetical protein HanIR_Chr13g0651521 [Helianthus annuus]